VTTEMKYFQSLIVPFNIEQAFSVDPISDYIIKDGINAFNFKSKWKNILELLLYQLH
jgi:hypothetical protein